MTDEARRMEARILQDPKQRLEWLRQDDLAYGGLIAGSVALVQPFLTASDLDPAGIIAVVSFAIAIPLLAALLMLGQQEEFRRRPVGLRVVSITKSVAQGLAVLGVAAAFWHMSWIAGVAVVVSGLVGIMVHAAGYSRLEGLDVPPKAPRA
jgi:cobalamin synthase